MEPPKFVSEYPFPPPYFRSFDSENSHQPPLIPLVHSEPYNGNVLPPLQDTFDPSKDYEMYFKSLLEELLTNVINFISESPNLTSALENKINLINSSLTNLYSGIAEYRTHHIISLKIGDSRLGSMETGVGLCRGLIEAVRRGCHIINMSYGEAVSWDNQGRFIRLAQELVYKHGIIFVASAGNNGPALSTVGAPGGTTSGIISVAALATQSSMTPAYSLTETLPASNYTWSSVGPTLDGALGVSIIAPGAAVTSVPSWTLSKNQLMNGTSMSSPNACGCITLLLSAAKSSNVSYTPHRIRKAVENSAKYLVDIDMLGQGHGLIQVDAAWNHLISYSSDPFLDVNIVVSILGDRFDRGIYLRQPSEVCRADTFKVNIVPWFHEDALPIAKINYEIRITLKSTVNWIKCPEKVLLATVGKTFNILIDPRDLEIGLHTGFVYGYDESNPAKGALFEVPVVVVKPEVIPPTNLTYSTGILDLQPSERIRRFIFPPPGTTFIDAILCDNRSATERASGSSNSHGNNNNGAVNTDDFTGNRVDMDVEVEGEDGSGRQVVVHALQLIRGAPYRDNEKQSYFMLTPGSQHTSMSWAVMEGITIEIVIARFWSTIGSTKCTLSLTFRGVQPVPNTITITPGQRVSQLIRLHATLCTAEISPSAKLDKWRAIIKPNAVGKVTPLGERDVLLDGSPIYQMILEYDIEQMEVGDVLPIWSGLNSILYESEFMAQFFMIYDSKKKLMGTGDAWASTVKLGKGKYTVRLQVKHENTATLETLSDMPMQLERTLKSSISLNFYSTQANAMSNGNKFNSRTLQQGTVLSLMVKEPSSDQLPKTISAGDVLLGTSTYLRKLNGAMGNGTKPGGFPIRYLVGDTKITSTTSGSGTSNTVNGGSSSKAASVTSAVESFEIAIRDAKLKHLKGLTGDDDSFSQIVPTIENEYPSHLPLHQIILAHMIKTATKTLSIESYDRVLQITDKIIGLVDKVALAASYGMNVDKDDQLAVSTRKEMDVTKSILIETLTAKAMTLCDILTLREKQEKISSTTSSLTLSADNLNIGTTTDNDILSEPKQGDVTASNNNTNNNITTSEEKKSESKIEDGNKNESKNESNDTNGSSGSSRSRSNSSIVSLLTATYKELERWDDVSADKYWYLVVYKNKLSSNYGAALKRINDLISSGADNKNKELVYKDRLLEERNSCLMKLHWDHVLTECLKSTRLASKDSYDAF
eukprot:gene6918-14055_t